MVSASIRSSKFALCSVVWDVVWENFDIFGFELSGADVAMISALNKDQRTGPDPDTFTGVSIADS